jgi:hypothetical protein
MATTSSARCSCWTSTTSSTSTTPTATPAGDAVLKMIAENLRVILRETDMIVRWGGEEFLAFLPAIPRQRRRRNRAPHPERHSSQVIRYQEHEISVNVSVGFAPFPLAPGGRCRGNARSTWSTWRCTWPRPRPQPRLRRARLQQLHLTSMEAIEQDLERAWRAGFVDWAA